MKSYQKLISACAQNKKLISVLVDPENYTPDLLMRLIQQVHSCPVDFVLVGGSMVSESVDNVVLTLKKYLTQPVILFPGNPSQVSKHADSLLFLSLISGRNPELLIGQQVQSAPYLRKMNIEIIPTGYILIDGGAPSAVQYMSQTQPIPADKTDIIKATAIAGEMLGLKALYLEAGSGANKPITAQAIQAVRQAVDIPIICGGGIQNADILYNTLQAGADMAVIGNVLEQRPEALPQIVSPVFSSNC
jgi:putative glycerol-1-phosphate prenyltransferase